MGAVTDMPDLTVAPRLIHCSFSVKLSSASRLGVQSLSSFDCLELHFSGKKLASPPANAARRGHGGKQTGHSAK